MGVAYFIKVRHGVSFKKRLPGINLNITSEEGDLRPRESSNVAS